MRYANRCRAWLLGALCVGLLLATAAARPASGATLPGRNGALLVLGVQHENGGLRAHLVDVTSGAVDPVELPDGAPQAADWSPDGTQIAVTLFSDETAEGTSDLWVTNADGSDPHLIAEAAPGTRLLNPTWAPDGERIALIEWEQPVATLATVRPDGTGYVRLGPLPREEFPVALRWSPQGDRLLVELFGDLTTLIGTIDVATLEISLYGFGSEPDWSPDGQSIVFFTRDAAGVAGATTIMAADGTGATPIPELAQAGILGLRPTWAPDGTTIAFVYDPPPAEATDVIGFVTTAGRLSFLDPGFEGIVSMAWQPVPTPSGFVDVPADHTFSADIAWLRNVGLTYGCDPPGWIHFCPERVITRGEAAAMLVRQLGLVAPAGADFFSDDDHSIFAGDLDAAAAAGIFLGCNPPDNDHVCPLAPLRRGPAAALFARALDLGPPAANHFVDDDDSVFATDIDRIADADITRGCDPPANRNYCPNETMTRGQFAAFMHRAFG